MCNYYQSYCNSQQNESMSMNIKEADLVFQNENSRYDTIKFHEWRFNLGFDVNQF